MPRAANFLRSQIPGHLHNPVGLTVRLLRSRRKEAYFAMGSAALGLVMTPLDLLMSRRERRRYASAPPPKDPILIVAGPPRSGTTLVAQTLVRHLGARYVNNLTALFPRSPIVANTWLSGCIRPERVEAHSFFGRTTGLSGHNDGLHLWDRWLGSDRTRVATELDPERREAMIRFFGAFQQAFPGPLVLKNNSLNACASLIADALPTARFVCLERDPEALVKSLLVARQRIHGDTAVRYGVGPDPMPGETPVESTCRQVHFLAQRSREQQERIGKDRFLSLAYEDFCEAPREWADRIAQRFDLPVAHREATPEAFEVRRGHPMPAEDLVRIRTALAELRPPERQTDEVGA